MNLPPPDEELLSVASLMRLVPSPRGKHPHPVTGIRWITRGRLVNGARVHLEGCRVGVGWCSSVEALHRFITRCSARPGEVETPQVKPSKALLAAEAELERMGL